MAGKDLEKFIERYPTYIEALEILEQKDKRIAELEEQLKNAIVLPISVKQEIYYVYETDISGDIAYTIDKGFVGTILLDGNIWFRGIYDSGLTYWHLLKDFNSDVFATKEEAQEKLKEIKGND